MYGKLYGETLEELKLSIHSKSGDIFSNDPAVITQNNYKKVVFTDPPEVEPGYVAVYHWSEGEDEITQVWEVVPEENPYESTVEEEETP